VVGDAIPHQTGLPSCPHLRTPGGAGPVACETLLRVGSAVALEARQLIHQTSGYRTSAGIACNKLLAKLVSGLHKPDDQTVMLPVGAAAFVSDLHVMALPGATPHEQTLSCEISRYAWSIASSAPYDLPVSASFCSILVPGWFPQPFVECACTTGRSRARVRSETGDKLQSTTSLGWHNSTPMQVHDFHHHWLTMTYACTATCLLTPLKGKGTARAQIAKQ
jgi:hypothetical protein